MANATSNFRAFTLTVSDVSDIVIENKWLLCGGAALGISALVLYNRSFASKACDLTKRNINSKFRGLFNKTFRMTESGPRDTDHSHPRSARNRTDAERSIDNFITMAGFEPYSISTSARDNVGQRLYYSAKDIDLPYQNVKVSSNHVLRMIDVDYYSNVKDWLWLGRPLIIYTFVPETVGGDVIEGVFHIENDVAHVTYNGGGTYVHQLWDYNLDHFIIPGAVWSLMVKVDQVKTPGDPQRRVVLLTPTTWYLSIFDWLFNNPNTLKRRKLTYGAANVSTYSKTVGDNTKCMVSMSPNGSPASVDVEYKTFVGLCMRLQQSKHPNMTDVEKYLRVDGIEEAHVLAPIIFAAYAGGWYGVSYKQLDKMVDCGVAKAPHYQIPGPLITEDGEDIGVEVFKPVVTGAAILPRRSYNNDRQAIEGRINKVKNETKPPGKYLGYMREFVAAFPLSEYDPVSIDEVIVRQNRPAQRARSENGKHWGGHEPFIVRSFMKKESYQSITDPRNISSCPVSHTMLLSSYTYAAKEYFKTLPWWMPGKTPVEITQALRELVAGEDEVLANDYSRLDGTISAFLRQVERAVYMRMFKKKYHSQLSDLLNDEIHPKAFTATGLKYDPGFSRLSGSPLTTDGNTIIVGFAAYCAARNAHKIGAGCIADVPGLVYGDDKVMVGIPQNVLETTALRLGLKLKCDVVRRGSPVTYLSRVFIDPWVTDTSMQAPLRALGKIHLTCIRNVDKRIVSRHKAEGYFTTDSKTPLLSELCIAIMKDTSSITALQLANPELERERNFWASEYGNASWPQDPLDRDVMEGIVADELQVSVSELRELIRKIKNDEDYEPIQFQFKQTVEAVVHEPGKVPMISRKGPKSI